MPYSIPSLFALLALACAGSPGGVETGPSPAEVVIYSVGARSELERDDREVVLQHLRRLLSSCSVDSARHPSVFSLGDPAAWSQAISSPRLWAKLARAEELEWFQGRAGFRELLLELPDGRYPGNLLGRGAAGVVQFTKCDGLAVIKLVCLREVSSLLPASYGHSCNLAGSS